MHPRCEDGNDYLESELNYARIAIDELDSDIDRLLRQDRDMMEAMYSNMTFTAMSIAKGRAEKLRALWKVANAMPEGLSDIGKAAYIRGVMAYMNFEVCSMMPSKRFKEIGWAAVPLLAAVWAYVMLYCKPSKQWWLPLAALFYTAAQVPMWFVWWHDWCTDRGYTAT